MRKIFALISALMLLAPAAFAQADTLGYPSFKTTAPVTVNAARIVIQNDKKQTQAGDYRLGSASIASDTVERYLRARIKPSGTGPVLRIRIAKAGILNQGRTELGGARSYIEIELDVAALSGDYNIVQKRAHVVAKRNAVSGAGPRLGNLPPDSRSDEMGEVMTILDQRLLAALKNEMKLLP